MNRYFKILTTAVAAAGLLASCNREDVTPEQPDLPGISKYEQLTFSTADENAGKTATRAVWSDPNGKGKRESKKEKGEFKYPSKHFTICFQYFVIHISVIVCFFTLDLPTSCPMFHGAASELQIRNHHCRARCRCYSWQASYSLSQSQSPTLPVVCKAVFSFLLFSLDVISFD